MSRDVPSHGRTANIGLDLRADPNGFVASVDAPALGSNEVHLWHAVLAAGDARTARIQAREVLHEVLRRYLGPRELDFELAAHGKPGLKGNPELQFNLSHCGMHVVIALARSQPLGVDIESLSRRVDALELARRFFHADEAAALSALPGSAQADAFLSLWTHKEAVLKALGHGLAFGLDRLRFALDGTGRVQQLRALADDAEAAVHWQLHAFMPAPALTGCLAWRGPPRRVRRLRVA